MDAWSEMSRELEDEVWARFYARFQFRPSTHPADWPGINEPTPSLTYSIAKPFNDADSRDAFLAMAMQLNLAVLDALRRCVESRTTLYILDWQHQCYIFNPHSDVDFRNPRSWRREPFPDGDYYMFLDPAFMFGTFGHPWEETICLFGQRLIDAFNGESVPWLGPLMRVNGTAA